MTTSPKNRGPVPRPVEQRFWEKVEKGEGCWRWIGKKNKNGYGLFVVFHNGSARGTGAHRMAYYLTNGPIELGMYVLHSCDNPSCVNPAHLSLGTQFANMQQASARGRLVRERKAPQTRCLRGHPMSGKNLYEWKGTRKCRACGRINDKNRVRVRIPAPPVTSCRHGHSYTPENIYWYKGLRMCRACRNANEAKRKGVRYKTQRG